MAEIGMICTRPGCDQSGPSLCASCRLVGYCCRTCQLEDWPRHKEEDCQGHIRKVGMSYLQKAERFGRDRNYVQLLRYSELDLVKLKQLNDCPIEALDDALRLKFNALNFTNRNREALACAQERYCLYLTTHTHPPAIRASFQLIESCIHNKEYEDAALYARTTWETITLSRDSHIPDNLLQWFTAQGAFFLARAMLELAQNGDIPPEANQTVGQEAIGLARRALEIHTRMHRLEHADVADDMKLLAHALDYFNDVDDDEALRLYEQSISITTRVEGSMSANIAAVRYNLGRLYFKRAHRCRTTNGLILVMSNLEKALSHYTEAARIYKAINYTERADDAVLHVANVEELQRQCTIARAALSSSSSSSSSAAAAAAKTDG